jgi:hypothetical protein
MILRQGCRAAVVDSNYFEGGDGGIGIHDLGNYNTVTNNLLFPGYGTLIDATAFTYGGVYTNNLLSAGSVANTKLIKVTSDSAFGGPGKTVSGNTFVFSGSGGAIVGVVGIVLAGLDPRVSMVGNTFDPRGPWVGGAGTKKIDDASTQTDGAGSGLCGFGVVDVGNYEFPFVGHGAYGVGLDSTVLTAANIAVNVLTISKASDFVITCASAQTVNSFSAPNLEGKLFWLRTTNANTTFANTANLKMAGSGNYTPGGAGASLQFKVHAGVAWETARVSY